LIIRQFVTSDDAIPLPAGQLALPYNQTTLQSTTVVFAIVPIILVYPFLQKYFAKGAMIGSVKG
jgi:putative aldouronate transport system permease protein